MGMVLLFSLVGAFVVRGNPVDIIVAVIAGTIGLILRFCGYPLAPIVIGMALGKIFEEKLRQGLVSTSGDVWEFLLDPIALFIFGLTLLIVLLPTLTGLKARKNSETVQD